MTEFTGTMAYLEKSRAEYAENERWKKAIEARWPIDAIMNISDNTGREWVGHVGRHAYGNNLEIHGLILSQPFTINSWDHNPFGRDCFDKSRGFFHKDTRRIKKVDAIDYLLKKADEVSPISNSPVNDETLSMSHAYTLFAQYLQEGELPKQNGFGMFDTLLFNSGIFSMKAEYEVTPNNWQTQYLGKSIANPELMSMADIKRQHYRNGIEDFLKEQCVFGEYNRHRLILTPIAPEVAKDKPIAFYCD